MVLNQNNVSAWNDIYSVMVLNQDNVSEWNDIYSVMVLNQDNVSEWNAISTQWWFWIKIMCPSEMTYLLSDGSESRWWVEWRIYSVMVLNQNNVSEWNDISTRWWFWIKIMCLSGMTYLLSDGSESRWWVEWRIYSVMVLNQDNVSEWNDISTQWWFWIKIMCLSGMTYLLSDGSESR